jgi:hypothetical protein
MYVCNNKYSQDGSKEELENNRGNACRSLLKMYSIILRNKILEGLSSILTIER